MDHQLSSPTSIASSVTAPNTASEQPTYTTAGTIYNPSSTQPLQPPTRRGRSFKWSTGGLHPDLALLPKSALASLSIGRLAGSGTSANNNSPGPRFVPVQQYSPLQQNYDRAANPFFDPDNAANMQSETNVPRMRSGNTPAPLVNLFSAKQQDEGTESPVYEEEDDEDDNPAMDPLMNMPVKSLHNLASYPNPNQKRAQKVLLRGSKPNLAGLCPATSFTAPPAAPTREYDAFQSPELRPAQSDPCGLRRAQLDLNHGRYNADQASSFAPFDRSYNVGPNGAEHTTTALSTGPGAPRPLTAGPPGQRQYRPSTFESTFKALSVPGDQQNHNEGHDGDMALSSRQSQTPVDFDGPSLLANSVPLFTDTADPAGTRQAVSPWPARLLPDDYLTSTELSGRPRGELGPVGTATSSGSVVHVASRDPLSHAGSVMSKASPRPTPPGRMTDRQLAARHENLDNHWYAGADFMGKTTLDHIEDARQRKFENKYGAIGVGRPSKNKFQYRPIGVHDANRMPVADHAESLINIMFGSLLRHIEQQDGDADYYQHGKPAPIVVDDVDDGRTLVFGKSKKAEAGEGAHGADERRDYVIDGK